MAVTAVAVAAVLTAVMVQRNESDHTARAAVAPARIAADGPRATAADPAASAVVKAPPLDAQPTRAMGGFAACTTCGVVEMVVAVQDAKHKEPRGYQMHIRMDDGSRRTIEQRGALAPGSRVVVDGSSVKPMS